MLFFVLILLVAAGVASPYILVAVKRRKMLRRLCTAARRCGFRVRSRRRFAHLAPNRGREYDLLFECKTHAYAVKLWSAVRKNTSLVIRGGYAAEVGKISAPLETGRNAEGGFFGVGKRVPVTKNKFRMKRAKTVKNILLIYPPYREMTVVNSSVRKKLAFGDEIFGKTLLLPGDFEKLLEENRPQNTENADKSIANVNEKTNSCTN